MTTLTPELLVAALQLAPLERAKYALVLLNSLSDDGENEFVGLRRQELRERLMNFVSTDPSQP